MTCRMYAFIAAALLAVAAPVSAQDKPLSINLGGGFTVPYSDLKNAFGVGGNFQFGADFRVGPMAKIQAEYGYNRLGSKDIQPGGATLPAGVVTNIPLTANNTMHDFDASLIVGPSLKDKKAAPYGIIGAGVYHQIVNVTTPAVGVATVCDPWLLICYPAPVAVDQIIGSRSNTAFGYNLGAGVQVKVAETAHFYAEFRYIHTYGPTFTDSAGASIKANGNYFPFTFGFRFYSED